MPCSECAEAGLEDAHPALPGAVRLSPRLRGSVIKTVPMDERLLKESPAGVEPPPGTAGLVMDTSRNVACKSKVTYHVELCMRIEYAGLRVHGCFMVKGWTWHGLAGDALRKAVHRGSLGCDRGLTRGM
ncbi:hypothetical protein Efla_007563 [Eimeria flavescens]